MSRRPVRRMGLASLAGVCVVAWLPSLFATRAAASPPAGSIVAVTHPQVLAASMGQAAGNWTITVSGGTFAAGDTISVSVMDTDDPGTDVNCNSHTDAIGFSGLPTVTAGTPTPSNGVPATFNVTIDSGTAPCGAQPVNDQMVIHFTNSSAAGQTLTVSNVRYDLGNTVAAGPVVIVATGDTGGSAPGSGPALTNSGAASASNAVVSTVTAGVGGGPGGLSPNTPNQPIPNVVLSEKTAGAVPKGFVCLSINQPSGAGGPNFTPSSAPVVSSGGNGATVSNGSGGPVGTSSAVTLGSGAKPTTLSFAVATASSSATTYTVSGLRLDTGSATGEVVIGIGTDAGSVVAACANAASSSPSLGTTTPSGALDPMTRLFGSDRIGTAIAISADSFPAAHSASSAVLARADLFPDALAGGPLAAAKHGPLLLTGTSALDPATEAELTRAASPGATVYLVGGEAALGAAVAGRLTALGFAPVRYDGPDRFGTAVAVASQGLGNPTNIFLATGTNFPDGLAGVPAAVADGAAILLSDGSMPAPATTSYLSGHSSDHQVALGGPAAAAYPSATPVVGADRYATSVMIAATFFPSPNVVGLASGDEFADALTGGPHAAAKAGPLLLVQLGGVPASVRSYLSTNAVSIAAGFVYGGPAVIADATLADAQRAISGS
jgi:hypothetical protein